MKRNLHEDSDRSLIKLDEALTIHQVSKCLQKWIILFNVKKLTIDASVIKEIDGAGMQLLIYLVNRIHSNNGIIEWSGIPSQYFQDSVKLAGMMKALQYTQGESK